MSKGTSLWMRGVLALAMAAWVVAGCGEAGPHPAGGGESGGEHHHSSVHGGVAVELGEHQYQLDVVHDPAAGVLNAWVMDAHVENFVRIPMKAFDVVVVSGSVTQTVTLSARANSGTGETVGDTSQFQGEAAGLKGWARFEGLIPELEVRGTKFKDVRFRYPAVE